MATRYIRNTVILAKVEGTYGTDSVPTGAANAMLVSNLSINPLNAQNVPRELIFGFMGGFQHLVGNRFVECGFDIELVGNGTSGGTITAPSWGDVLKACGFTSALDTVNGRVDYTPISSSFTSLTIYWYDDGLLHKVTGARGNVAVKLNANGRPVLSFMFKGLYSAPTAAANASPTLTGFKVPEVVTEANTADLNLGCTHTVAAAAALTGGTSYPSLGLEFSPNNAVEHIALLGGESVDQTGRDASCSIQLDLTAAQEVTLMASVAAATLTSVGLVHGTTAGYKTLVFLPYVQLINPRKAELSGKRLVGFDGRVTPSAGNDEMRIVVH